MLDSAFAGKEARNDPTRVLVVVGGFPASGGARIDKFVKLMPRFGLEPVVLFAKETASRRSRELLATLYPPELETYPIGSFGWSYFTERFLDRGPEARYYGLLKLLSFPERCVFVPDHMVRWIPFGVRKARELVAKKRIRFVLTSSPPESTHLIGLALKRMPGITWVADFRDLWTQKKLLFRPATPLHDLWCRRLERRVMKSADHVIANTAENMAYYLKEFGLAKERVSVIPNGFDREDLPSPDGITQSDDVFQIGHMGFLDKHTYPWKLFIDALRMLAARVGRDKVRFVHCGYHSKEVGEYLRRSGVEDLVVSHAWLSHDEAMRIIAATNLRLVLLYENEYSRSIVPAKLYNYLIMNGPILAIAPEIGAVARIISETRTGATVSPKSGVEKVYLLLRNSYEHWARGKPLVEPNQERIADYDRQRHVAQLADILLRMDTESSRSDSKIA